MKSIQMVDLERQYRKIEDEVSSRMQQVILSSAFIQGSEVKTFEQELGRKMNVKHCISCANGTDALQISLMALGLKAGDEIIVPSFTYIASVEAAALLGIKPVFVEVDPQTFNIEVNAIEAVVTDKTKAIIVVHLYGQCANMEPLLAVAKKHKLSVIEDNAQAINAEYVFTDGRKVKAGCMGDIGTTSFFPSKNLGCYGDGGALFTSNDELAQKIRMIANHGQQKKYHHDTIGINSRLDTLQAAVLNIKLGHLDEYTEVRQQGAAVYDQQLSELSQVVIPYRDSHSTHVFHQYTLQVEKRDDLQHYLKEQGIPSMIYYPIPTHLQEGYKYLGYKKGDLPLSESLCQKVISLPIHSEITPQEITYICDHIKKFYTHG